MNATHSPSDHWRRPKVPIIIPARGWVHLADTYLWLEAS